MKEYLNMKPARLEGYGCDSVYVYDWEVVDEAGDLVGNGCMRGKPYNPRLPVEFASGWTLPCDYPDMHGRSPTSGQTVFVELPWFRFRDA